MWDRITCSTIDGVFHRNCLGYVIRTNIDGLDKGLGSDMLLADGTSAESTDCPRFIVAKPLSLSLAAIPVSLVERVGAVFCDRLEHPAQLPDRHPMMAVGDIL